jgi:hypothetical protein
MQGIMGWSVTLLMAPTQAESRLENLQNLLLTAVAFKFAVNDILPNLPFLTALDQYVLVNFLFLFLQTMEAYVVGAMVKDPAEDRDLIPWRFPTLDRGDKDFYHDGEGRPQWIREALEFEKWYVRCAGTLWLIWQLCAAWFVYDGIMTMRLQSFRRSFFTILNVLRLRLQTVQEDHRCSVKDGLRMVFKSAVVSSNGSRRGSSQTAVSIDEDEWANFITHEHIGATQWQARSTFLRLASFNPSRGLVARWVGSQISD